MLLNDCLNKDRFQFGHAARRGMLNDGKEDQTTEMQARAKKRELAEALQMQIRYEKFRKQRNKHDFQPPRIGEGLAQQVEECTLSAEQAGFAPSRARDYANRMYEQYAPVDRGVHLTQQGVSCENVPDMMIIVCSAPADALEEFMGLTTNSRPLTNAQRDAYELERWREAQLQAAEHQFRVEQEYQTMMNELRASYEERQLQQFYQDMDALEQEIYFRSDMLAAELARQNARAQETQAELDRTWFY